MKVLILGADGMIGHKMAQKFYKPGFELYLNTRSKKDFLKETDGSYKLSIKFTDFYKKGESFHYPFGRPNFEDTYNAANDWWYKKFLYPDTPNSDYADCMFPTQMAYVNKNKFNKKCAKAYHFDATKFGLWLKEKTNICHILGKQELLPCLTQKAKVLIDVMII